MELEYQKRLKAKSKAMFLSNEEDRVLSNRFEHHNCFVSSDLSRQ